MRVLLVPLCAATMLGLALPAHADPAGNDAAFLAVLSKAGVTFSSPDQAIAAGKAVCELMNQGRSGPDIVKQLIESNPGFDPQGAGKFTGIATVSYCPGYVGNYRPPNTGG